MPHESANPGAGDAGARKGILGKTWPFPNSQPVEFPQAARAEFTAGQRRRCRNCGSKLQEPSDSRLEQFCGRTCFVRFFRARCIVCEQPIAQKTKPRQVCDRCRGQFRRHRERFSGTRYLASVLSHNASRSADKSGLKTRSKADRTFRHVAGPKLSQTSFRLATILLDLELIARLDHEALASRLVGGRYRIVNNLRSLTVKYENGNDWRHWLTIGTAANDGEARRMAQTDNDRRMAEGKVSAKEHALHIVQAMQNGRLWWLSDGTAIGGSTARHIIADPNVVSVGDALFDGVLAQTFRWNSNGEGGPTAA